MSYPLEKVDFPTVTLCPESPDPDRWGLAVKLFDHLEVHCMKPYFIAQNTDHIMSVLQEARKECGNFTENQQLIQTILSNATQCLRELWQSKLQNMPFEEWLGISGVNIGSMKIFEKIANNENMTQHILNAMEEMKKSLQFIDRCRHCVIRQLIAPPPPPPYPPPPPPPPLSLSKTSVPLSTYHLLKSEDKSLSSKQYLAQSSKDKAEIDLCDDLCSKRALKIAMEYTLLFITIPDATRSAGQSLAYFRKFIGQGPCSSESNFLLNDWSLVPMYPSDKNRKPSQFETKINNVMEEITYHISGGRLKNVSILDLPGFGSMTDFNQRLSSEPTNMALLKQWKEKDLKTPNPSEDLFYEHSDLGSMWYNYVTNSKEVPFPPTKRTHNIFNFTKFILEDFDTFVFAMKESHLTIQERRHDSSLQNLANKIFTSLNTEDFIDEYGFNDNLLLGCTYDKPLKNMKMTRNNRCNLFKPTLTNNGLCYSFNGLSSNILWNDGKVVQSFERMFKSEHSIRKFGTAGKFFFFK